MISFLFYTQQKCLSKNEGKIKTYLDMQKLKNFMVGIIVLKMSFREEAMAQVDIRISEQWHEYTRIIFSYLEISL